MIIKFNNPYLFKLAKGESVKGKPLYGHEIIEAYKKKLIIIQNADNSIELRKIKGLHFEALKGNKKGLYSIRVNKQYRLEFNIENDVITMLEIILIEDLSKHYE